MLSMIVPVYDEEGAVEASVRELHAALQSIEQPWEIIIVDDGSRDATARILKSLTLDQTRIVTHARNMGNGATIKTGIREAKGTVIGTIDADGTYPADGIPRLYRELRDSGAAMIVGARDPRCFPMAHRFAKAVLGTLALAVTGRQIPDLNSGLRLMRSELCERFAPLSPDRFSFHITVTIAASVRDLPIRYSPIAYGERVGTSKLSAGFGGVFHFLKFALLIPLIAYKSAPRRREDALVHAKSLVHSAP